MSAAADDALSRGFDAGNYAAAYTSTDLDTAWEVVEDGEQHDELRSAAPAEFRGGFVIGFFSSFETSEISAEHLEEWLEALGVYAESMQALGIAVDLSSAPEAY